MVILTRLEAQMEGMDRKVNYDPTNMIPDQGGYGYDENSDVMTVTMAIMRTLTQLSMEWIWRLYLYIYTPSLLDSEIVYLFEEVIGVKVHWSGLCKDLNI